MSDAAEAKLKLWLGCETWHTGHPNDMARWYDFVDQLHRDHQGIADEAILVEHIEELAGTNRSEDLRQVIRDRIALALNILDFLARTRR